MITSHLINPSTPGTLRAIKVPRRPTSTNPKAKSPAFPGSSGK